MKLALACLVFGCSSLPPALPGPDAERLAHEMTSAVNARAWDQTGAVRWTLFGSRHLWDRRRHFARVEWNGARALVDLSQRAGRGFEDGAEAKGEQASRLLDSAHARWTNDSFWLNPVVKAFDDGTVRERVLEHGPGGERGLVVRFTSGGRTPGDVFLFWLGGDGTPIRWQMWAAVLPLKGASTTWERWIRLDTGARVSTLHRTAALDLVVSDVKGARTLAELEPGPDPFADLEACRAQRAVCSSF